MNLKSRRFFLYLLLAVMVLTQVAFTKSEKDNTLEPLTTDNTENAIQTNNTIENITDNADNTSPDVTSFMADDITTETEPETQVAAVAADTVEYYPVVVNSSEEDVADEVLLGEAAASEVSKYQDQIVAYVEPYLSVRTEASSDSAVVGKLYPASYAQVVERGDEWTKIKSGNVVGYIQNLYVCFDKEAEVLAGQINKKLSTGITLEEEKKKKEEEERRKAAAANNLYLLAAIIDWEANAECYEGKLAVGYVVTNRVANPGYGSSVTAVLSAPGQFSGVTNGSGGWSTAFQNRLNKYINGTQNDCLRAAQDVIAGNNNPLNATYLHFNTHVSSYSQCQQIGNHYFYN
ncbi:MAG: cell wall hydrolase [Lachnospiraceae bacterium]